MKSKEKPLPKAGVKFINYELDRETKAAFKAWAHEKLDDFWNMAEKLCDSHYVLSVKYDEFNECLASFLTPMGAEHEHAGFILTGRGSSVVGAVMGVLYRHFVEFEGHWPIDKKLGISLDDE
jgi:hypothetical protein